MDITYVETIGREGMIRLHTNSLNKELSILTVEFSEPVAACLVQILDNQYGFADRKSEVEVTLRKDGQCVRGSCI